MNKIIIEFDASLPDLQSAITISGADDSGARIKLDVPAEYVNRVLDLRKYGAGKPLKVTIEVLNPHPKPFSDADILLKS